LTVDLPIGILRGLSTDTKPTSVNHGTLFFETDTGKTFYWNSNISEWIEQTDEKRWQVLGVAVLNVAGDSLIVQNLKPRKYLKCLFVCLPSTSANGRFRFNGDTGSNYADRVSANGGADAILTSQTTTPLFGNHVNNPKISIFDILNLKNQEKLIICHVVERGTAGAANPPNRGETVNKWANTTEKINKIEAINNTANDFDVGMTLIVLGHD